MVVVASPGMLENGASRMLFEAWCADERTGVMLTGYISRNTLAYKLKAELQAVHEHGARGGVRIHAESGQKLLVKARIDYVSFSAHSDYPHTRELVRRLRPDHIVFVHGQTDNARGLGAQIMEDISFGKGLRPEDVLQLNATAEDLAWRRKLDGPAAAEAEEALIGAGAVKPWSLRVYAPLNEEVVAIPFARQQDVVLCGRMADELQAARAQHAPVRLQGLALQLDDAVATLYPQNLREASSGVYRTARLRAVVTLPDCGDIEPALRPRYGDRLEVWHSGDAPELFRELVAAVRVQPAALVTDEVLAATVIYAVERTVFVVDCRAAPLPGADGVALSLGAGAAADEQAPVDNPFGDAFDEPGPFADMAESSVPVSCGVALVYLSSTRAELLFDDIAVVLRTYDPATAPRFDLGALESFLSLRLKVERQGDTLRVTQGETVSTVDASGTVTPPGPLAQLIGNWFTAR